MSKNKSNQQRLLRNRDIRLERINFINHFKEKSCKESNSLEKKCLSKTVVIQRKIRYREKHYFRYIPRCKLMS